MFKIALVVTPLAVVLTCSGCGIEPETLAALQDAVSAASAQQLEEVTEESDEEVVDVAFTPPYPHRNDPFAFPGQSTERPTIDPVAPAPTGEIATQVLGFAEVDQPRVLMRIGENTYSMKAGDRIQSVEIIRIRPPVADLSVGGQVRTVSMFDIP